MEVINDSTTLQSRIDSVLAAPIMEWDHSPEIQWQPGDPLWNRFDKLHRRQMIQLIGVTFSATGEYDKERQQPIVEARETHDDTIDGNFDEVDCEDCLVGVDREENSCWNCGQLLWRSPKKDQPWFYEERSQPVSIDFHGTEISNSNLEWFTEFFFNHPDRDHVRFRPVATVSCFQDYDPRAEPTTVTPRTLVYSRSDVDEMRTMFDDLLRRPTRLNGVDFDGDSPLYSNVVAYIREEMWALLNDEIEREMHSALFGDGSHELTPRTSTPSRLIVATPMQNGSSDFRGLISQYSVLDEVADWMSWSDSREDEFISYCDEDVRLSRLWFNLNPGPIESYNPPSPGVPIFWDSAQRRWAEIQIDQLMTSQESRPPDVPTITLQDTNPDLYRPGYERYFESENSHVPTPSVGPRHVQRPGPARNGRR
jgi:hypothetical protein